MMFLFLWLPPSCYLLFASYYAFQQRSGAMNAEEGGPRTSQRTQSPHLQCKHSRVTIGKEWHSVVSKSIAKEPRARGKLPRIQQTRASPMYHAPLRDSVHKV